MIRLLIDGRDIPVDSSAKAAISYDAAQLADIQSGRTARRIALEVPVTAETDRVFGNAGNPLTAERFNAATHRAVIRVDGTELFRGTAILTGAEKRGRKEWFKIEIKGDTALWARSAALRKLSDAGISSTRLLTPEGIAASWTDSRPVKFFPVDRADRTVESSSVSLLPVQNVAMTDDYWPFISVAELVNAIFRDAGYTLRSRFAETELFRSLYISGAYSVPDAAARKRSMDFLAGRTTDVSATADSFGRVYLSASAQLHSTGNIVDTVESYIPDADGKPAATGFFSTNGLFAIDEKSGVAAFTPKSDAVVGFEYSIAYVTDHVISSRTRLTGFDRIYAGNDLHVDFTLQNRYEDQRDKLLPDYNYKLMLFDDDGSGSRKYRLTVKAGNSTVTLLETSQRMTAVTMPAAKTISDAQLIFAESGSNVFRPYEGDWALYWGFVEERGRTEVEVKVRTQPEALTAGTPKFFNELFIDGALPQMNFTLLKRTTLRPVFASTAGYGAELSFRDVAAADVRQSELLDALRMMFDLQFCTDECTKTVWMEPYADFFDGDTVDWSDRIDLDSPITVSDPSLGMHDTVTLAYGEDDAAVARFNRRTGQRLGHWSFSPDSKATLDGEKRLVNPLFSATVSENENCLNARSAWIMQVRATDETSDDPLIGNFPTRIVRYAGCRPLAGGESWSDGGTRYPLAAFHFAGDQHTPGFSLCHEDRDGIAGLHTYHQRRLKEESEGAVVTLSLRLLPEEVAALQQFRAGMPSVRSRFRLDFDARSAGALYTLRAVDRYDPSQAVVRCTFIKTAQTV